jgi:hypothetical protein
LILTLWRQLPHRFESLFKELGHGQKIEFTPAKWKRICPCRAKASPQLKGGLEPKAQSAIPAQRLYDHRGSPKASIHR